jgi:hypothetical protein
MKKQPLIAAVVLSASALAACSTQQVSEFARALQTNAPPTTSQTVQQPTQPKSAPVTLVSAGTLNQCRTEVSPNRDALLVTAGHNNANQFFTCAVGAPMTIGRALASFNAHLIPILCDMSKPIVSTPVDEDASIVNCTYAGPKRLPTVVDNLPLKAI